LRVPALKVVRRSERNRIEVPGGVKPIRRVLLAAQTAGRIEALGAQEHDVVRAGQVILGLEDTIHKAAVNRTEAAVTRTRAAHRLAELELERHERLFRQGVASAAELDRARSEERATFGALGEAEAMLDEARELLTKTTIRAPFDGVLTAFDREVGDRVEIGEQIAEVIDISRVEIEIGVTDREIVALAAGDPVDFEVDVYPGRHFEGKIRRLGSALDPETRKFPVEVEADNPDRLLLSGMVARVSTEIGDEDPVIRLPRQAIIEEFGLSYVFVLSGPADSLIARRQAVRVRAVPFQPSQLQVIEGIEEGQQIAASNLRDLSDGLPVALEEFR
jgi:membrane fusion protein (multidrug efflux system)